MGGWTVRWEGGVDICLLSSDFRDGSCDVYGPSLPLLMDSTAPFYIRTLEARLFLALFDQMRHAAISLGVALLQKYYQKEGEVPLCSQEPKISLSLFRSIPYRYLEN